MNGKTVNCEPDRHRTVDVIEQGFDAVLRTGDATDSRLKTRTLGNFSHKIVGSPAYFQKAGSPVEPNDLVNHACLHHRFPSTGKLEIWPLNDKGTPIDVELPRQCWPARSNR
jgi:DNA-binding transcriptional LysR family regulator